MSVHIAAITTGGIGVRRFVARLPTSRREPRSVRGMSGSGSAAKSVDESLLMSDTVSVPTTGVPEAPEAKAEPACVKSGSRGGHTRAPRSGPHVDRAGLRVLASAESALTAGRPDETTR